MFDSRIIVTCITSFLVICKGIAATSLQPIPVPADPQLLRQIYQIKSSSSFIVSSSSKSPSNSIWVWTGLIRNPLTGKEIAHVHGLELVESLNSSTGMSMMQGFNSAIQLGRRKFLQLLHLENTHQNIPSYDASYSYITKKLFIYTQVDNHSVPLTEYRIRPRSPRRHVQPSKLLQECVTLGYRDKRNSSYIEIKWPSGRLLSTTKVAITEVSLPMPLSFFMKQYQVTNLIKGKSRVGTSKWISFAAQDTSGRSQEFYTFKQFRLPFFLSALGASTGSIEYQRYGECPSWFATGRFCTTELSARKYRSLRDVPRSKLELVARTNPNFLSEREISSSGYNLKADFIKGKDLLDDFVPWYKSLPFVTNVSKKRTVRVVI